MKINTASHILKYQLTDIAYLSICDLTYNFDLICFTDNFTDSNRSMSRYDDCPSRWQSRLHKVHHGNILSYRQVENSFLLFLPPCSACYVYGKYIIWLFVFIKHMTSVTSIQKALKNINFLDFFYMEKSIFHLHLNLLSSSFKLMTSVMSIQRVLKNIQVLDFVVLIWKHQSFIFN